MNCIIYHKNKIAHYIENVNVSGNLFIGSNKKVSIGKKHPYEIKYTNKYLSEPIENIDPENIEPAPEFDSIPVDSRKAVNAIIREQIAKAYDSGTESKILRLRLSGKLSDDDWSKYDITISEIVAEGKKFKDKYFPKDKS